MTRHGQRSSSNIDLLKAAAATSNFVTGSSLGRHYCFRHFVNYFVAKLPRSLAIIEAMKASFISTRILACLTEPNLSG